MMTVKFKAESWRFKLRKVQSLWILQSWKIRQQRQKFYKILGIWFLELLCLSSS